MHLARPNPSTGAFRVILIAVAAVTGGCACDRRTCNDITPGAIPQPVGTYACQWIQAEKARADQDDFVIYQYEWAADGVKLSPFGRDHVARIARDLGESPLPVVIEPAADDRVNAARKAELVRALAKSGLQVSPDSIILGRPEAEGLYGEEAEAIKSSMFNASGGGQGVGAGFGSNEPGVFQASQGSSFGTTSGSGGFGLGVY